MTHFELKIISYVLEILQSQTNIHSCVYKLRLYKNKHENLQRNCVIPTLLQLMQAFPDESLQKNKKKEKCATKKFEMRPHILIKHFHLCWKIQYNYLLRLFENRIFRLEFRSGKQLRCSMIQPAVGLPQTGISRNKTK